MLRQLERVQKAVEKAGKQDLIKEFENIQKALKDRGLIDAQVKNFNGYPILLTRDWQRSARSIASLGALPVTEVN